MEIEKRNKQIEILDIETEMWAIGIEKRNNIKDEYKTKIGQLSQLDDLNSPEARRIIHSLMEIGHYHQDFFSN